MDQSNRTLTNDAKSVLKAFTKGSYTLRTINGLAKDADLPGEQVNRVLNELISKRLVDQVPRNGNVYFFLTSTGRSLVYEIEQSVQGPIAALMGFMPKSG